jgi:acetyl-CoA synthetase (ADP-forming)
VATTPQLEDKVRQWGQAALSHGKPTALLLTPGKLVDGARQALRDIGCPYTDRLDDALRVLRAAVDYGAHPDNPVSGISEATRLPAGADSAVCGLRPGRLTEPETKGLLRAWGIKTTNDEVSVTPDDAVNRARAIGFPVVLKGVSRDLVHKSEAGAVQLNLDDEESLRIAWQTIARGLLNRLPDATLEGCVVQPMITGGIELIVGCRWDPQFGAVVLVGSGGVLVEILEDVQMAIAPVADTQAKQLIARLRVAPVLLGARGRKPADIDALADTVVRVSHLAAALGSRLIELDINPLLVLEAGNGTIAIDGRATIA